jgi:hypothetical protein
MTPHAQRSVARIVEELESQLRRTPTQGVLDRQAVEALDVVGHALAFTGHPRALVLWRDALWKQELGADARNAVTAMLGSMTKAAGEGRDDEISRICDCLHVVIDGAAGHEPYGAGAPL